MSKGAQGSNTHKYALAEGHAAAELTTTEQTRVSHLQMTLRHTYLQMLIVHAAQHTAPKVAD